ncbi:BTAD domain-containing putative transcriptional regulator [Kitasatospora sp. NPDC008050]|uniref:AfsR/SARP family transcriptional regulator n=1 Tax=Kitasatospora sp. NPDC008050 TaxID=3364021 RepID=UPI0036EEE88B
MPDIFTTASEITAERRPATARPLPPPLRAECRAGLSFSVLGPLTARDEDGEVDLGQPKQRAVLAALLLQDGSYTSVYRLVEAVWGERAPATAERSIHTYVYRLRRALTPPRGESCSVIASESGGYVVRVRPAALDLRVFERSLEHAGVARQSGDHAAVARHLREGLGLWRGTVPLSGVPGEYVERHRVHLGELRRSALAMRLSAELALGMVDPVVAELSGLVAEHPLDERFRALLMTALHRADRRAEALWAYHEARTVLRETLGVDPGRQLRRVHEQILCDASAGSGQWPAVDVMST